MNKYGTGYQVERIQIQVVRSDYANNFALKLLTSFIGPNPTYIYVNWLIHMISIPNKYMTLMDGTWGLVSTAHDSVNFSY